MPAHEQLTLETLDITTPELYRDHGYPWAAWDLLRREAPVFRYKNFMRADARASLGDVWIISKHEDIMEISRNPNTWNQHPELTAPKNGIPQRHIIAMDPPEHAVYRNLTSRHFTPRAMLYRSWFLGHFASGNHAAAPVLGKSAWRTAAGVRWPWRSTSQAWL